MRELEVNLESEHSVIKIKKRTRWFIVLVAIFFSAYILKPFMTSQLINRGDAYLNYGMLKDAIREYRKALFFNSSLSEIWNWLGYVYTRLGDEDNAVTIYKKAVQIDPKNRVAFYDLGMIYFKRKDFNTAKDCFIKASLIDPEYKIDFLENNYSYHKASLSMLSHCYERLGKINNAVDINRKILEYYPDDKATKERIERLLKLRKEGE